MKKCPTKNEKIVNQLFLMARDKERVFRAKVAAAIVIRGKVVSYGYNQHRTSWLRRKFQKNEHAHYICAEVDAVKNALRVVSAEELKKSTMFIVRAKNVGGQDVFGNAKPCKGCQMCIDWFEIRRIFYSNESGEMETL